MCLDIIDTKIFEGSGIGYKLFQPKVISWNPKSGVTKHNYNIVNSYYRPWTDAERNVRMMFLDPATLVILNDMPTGVWLEDKNSERIWSYSGLAYESGFHLYHSMRPKRINQREPEYIYTVFYKNVVASGKENGSRVIVAKEIFICPKGR